MVKKLLETSLGHNDQTWFSIGGKRVSEEDALELIENECNPYVTKDNEGVIVYFSEEDYQRLKEDKNYEVKE